MIGRGFHFPVFHLPYDFRLERIYPARRLRRQQEQRGHFVHSHKGRLQRQHPVRKTGRTFERRKQTSINIAG